MIPILLSLVVLGAVGFGVALAVRSRRGFAAQNQIVPGVATNAPASWAGAHSTEAKLHRRLRDAVAAARAEPRIVDLGLEPQVVRIESEALAIDDRLVAAAALVDRHRGPAIERIARLVEDLEDTVAAMSTGLVTDDLDVLMETTMTEIDIKLRALAEARAEVDRIAREA